MARTKTRYICQACAYESPKWLGRCPNCGEWNAFVEEVVQKRSAVKARVAPALRRVGGSGAPPQQLHAIDLGEETRLVTGVAEFDRVMGGGSCTAR